MAEISTSIAKSTRRAERAKLYEGLIYSSIRPLNHIQPSEDSDDEDPYPNFILHIEEMLKPNNYTALLEYIRVNPHFNDKIFNYYVNLSNFTEEEFVSYCEEFQQSKNGAAYDCRRIKQFVYNGDETRAETIKQLVVRYDQFHGNFFKAPRMKYTGEHVKRFKKDISVSVD